MGVSQPHQADPQPAPHPRPHHLDRRGFAEGVRARRRRSDAEADLAAGVVRGARRSEAVAARAEPVAAGGLKMAKVLVVEDNPANMTLAVFLLQSVGHTVLSALDAEAGLTVARAEQPDLILMDIQLPGMDGLEATAMLKRDAATRAIPVIALTALAMKGDEERIRAAGCDGYIAKPMRYQEFLAIIAAQLNNNSIPGA